VRARLVLTLRPPLPDETGRLRVGRRFRGQVAELFATDVAPDALLATDVLSLYLGRGGFERMLGEEDRQTDPDRFVSSAHCGQELFQILCQWVDNVRLRLGQQALDEPVRQTQWAAALAEAAPVRPATSAGLARIAAEVAAAPAAPVRPEPVGATGPGQVAAATGRGWGRFGGEDFVWQSDGTLVCPAGQTLRPQHRQSPKATVNYVAPAWGCAPCALRAQCMGHGGSGKRGRSVTVRLATSERPKPPAPPAPCPKQPLQPPVAPGPQPVLWQDLPAVRLRRSLRRALERQRVEVEAHTVCGPAAPGGQTRAQRAHQRLTYAARQARNALPPTVRIHVRLWGLPPRLWPLAGPEPPC
jgi:hypothetical protein